MSKKPKMEDASRKFAELDIQLDGLLGALGNSLSEVLESLEKSGSAEVRRSHDFSTPKGDLRAETGVRIRFANEEWGGEAPQERVKQTNRRTEPSAKPGERTKKPAAAGQQNDQSPVSRQSRQPDIVSYTHDTTWTLCADLPGASIEDVKVEVDTRKSPKVLSIHTIGHRRYFFEQALPGAADPSTMSFGLRNGVLEVTVKLTAGSETLT